MMASAQVNSLFQCCSCENTLTVNSHSLPCLHNLCQTCMKEKTLTGEKESTVRKCPKCDGEFTVEEECNLLPFLSTCIKCHSKEFECHFCSKEDTVSIAKNWCQNCEQLFCNICNRVHRKFEKSHICKELEEMDRSEWIELVMSEKCFLHGKERALFCEQCNTCFCDTCYRERHSSSACMSVSVLNVGDEVLRRKSEEGPILEKEVKEFEKIVKKSSEKLKRCSGEINAEHDLKLGEIWRRYDEKVEVARLEAIELSADMERKKDEEERRIGDWLAENERMEKQIEIWLLSCEHLLVEAEKDVDILCGLNLLKLKVRSWQKNWNRQENIFDKIEFSPYLSNLLLETIDSPFSVSSSSSSCVEVEISSSSSSSPSCVEIEIRTEFPPLKKLEKSEVWNLLGSNRRWIRSIHVAEEDDHVFLCDLDKESLIELSEFGEFVHELSFCDERNRNANFRPFDVCSISPDMLVVCGRGRVGGEGKLFFIERTKIPPFLKIEKIIETKKYFVSLCQNNDSIFVCDLNFEISCFTKKGEEIKSIKIDGMTGSDWNPRIRVDSSSGNFWGSRYESSEIVSFNSEGERLSSVKKEEKDFFDFYVNKFGHFYFSTKEGIFSIFPEKKLLFKFDKKSEQIPLIFVSENKMFVYVKNDGKQLIQIFKIFY